MVRAIVKRHRKKEDISHLPGPVRAQMMLEFLPSASEIEQEKRLNKIRFEHKKKHAPHHRPVKDYLDLDFRCPTPFKKCYPNTESANAFIDMYHSDDDAIKPYKCPCAAIHIGHPRYDK